MNTKKFDVISVEDYGVVVDSISDKVGILCYHPFQPYLFHSTETNKKVWSECRTIVATIGKRIEGLPLIELPDMTFDWRNFLLQKAEQNNIMDSCGISQVSLGTAEWACRQLAAQSKGVYSEEDMRNAWSAGCNATASRWGQCVAIAQGLEDPKREGYKSINLAEEKEKYIQSLQKNKLPIAVGLEMEKLFDHDKKGKTHTTDENEAYHGAPFIWQVKITNPETNTIKPVEVYYEKAKMV